MKAMSMEKLIPKILFTLILPLVIIFILSTGYTYSDTEPETLIPYPEGYRDWTHVKSEILGPDNPIVRFRGIHHIYANEKAMAGYTTGEFPEGSIIVFDLLETKPDTNSDIKEG